MVTPPENSGLGFLAEVDSNEFHASCIALANKIDSAIGNNAVLPDVQDLAKILKHVCACQRRGNNQTKAMIMMLMISAKNACELGWFPQRETQELLAFVEMMWKSFSSPENAIPASLSSPCSQMPLVMKRFYPFTKLGHVLISFEAKPESNVSAKVKDFHISKNMPFSRKRQVGLFVVQTDDISKSSCLVHPQKVSFLLNGMDVQNRVIAAMDTGPQRPTNVSPLVNPGVNLLQTIGCFEGSYFVVIAFVDDIPLPDQPPMLKNYVHSEVTQSNSDCDVIEGPSRISLNCPISKTRIKLPVKGHVCRHLQSFDFWNYVGINKRRPSWRCPHCNQSVCYTDIRVDQNMLKILQEVGCNVPDVVISADGSWRVVTENDENVPETTHNHGVQNLGPAVMDLTRDENEMETSGGTRGAEHKPCVPEFQAPSTNTHNLATDYPMLLNLPSSSVNALPQLPQTLNVFDGQQQGFMNLNTWGSAARQSFPMEYLPTSSQQDRLATNPASFLRTSMPAAQSSQFQASHVPPLGQCLGRTPELLERWSHIHGIGTNQTQPPMSPPLQHLYGMQNQNQNQMLPIRSMSPAQQRPMASSITHPQTFTTNYGGTSNQRPIQRSMQRPNPGRAAEQFSSTQLGPGPALRDFVNTTSANTGNWRPLTRMRGSLTPGTITGYEHMIIRPTRPVQAQAQTLPPPQPAAYSSNNYIADEIQAFLAHPSYPVGMNETQDGQLGSTPVAEGLGASGSFWSMPPEAW
ncbi:unnamed protein product [Microthlaspi erraticum]|uniref:SP-RING-type domain-containing protein n=1 Tax=Microthlaspi erraticum TaxID=1685480 RepID=A0A6D2KJA7_9BRAS|nr:unnamed protein product [Microthlaspi erraticum]